MALTSHETRDAHHAIRQELSIALEAYKRRIYGEAKEVADQRITELQRIAELSEEPVEIDGTKIGRVAAAKTLNGWGIGKATAAIDSTEGAAELESGASEQAEGQGPRDSETPPDWQP